MKVVNVYGCSIGSSVDDLSIRRPGFETVIQPTPLPLVEVAVGKLRKVLQDIRKFTHF